MTQNIMEDVGEENLRFFKERLVPLVMLKKYTVKYKPAAEEKSSFQDLDVSIQRHDKTLMIKLSGKLNTNAALEVKEKILSALDGANKVTFDLDGLEYISSAGLRIFVAAMKQIKAQGGDMSLLNVGKQVREVLDITGFVQIFNVED